MIAAIYARKLADSSRRALPPRGRPVSRWIDR